MGNPDVNPHLTTATPDAQAQGQVVSRADIQYVPSSISVTRYIRGDFILPPSIDEAELSNSLIIYDEMLLDPTIAGIRLWMNVNVLADGLSFEAKQFEPPAGEEDVNQTDAMEADWARRYIKETYARLKFTDRDILLICWDLLDGARIPHKLAEATFDTIRSGEFTGMPSIQYLKPKPRRNYNLVFDTMNTFRGIVAIVTGGSLALWTGFIFDVSKLPNAIAAEKLIMFTADDRDGIPKSLYNAAYGPWARLLSLYADMMSTSRAAAGGKQTVVLGEKAAQQYTNPKTGEVQTAEERTRDELAQNGNNGTLVLMHGAIHTVHYPQANALNTFIEGIKQCKREMWTALTTNDKTSMEGEHGSGLSQDNAADQSQPVIEMLKNKLCLALDGLSFSLLKLAKGEQYAMKYCPTASMKRGDVVDFPAAGATWAAIEQAEASTPSQKPFLAKLVGIQPPNQAEMEKIGETWNKMMDLKASPPEPSIIGTTQRTNAKDPPKK